jgi:hypothetical protein
MMRNWPSPLMGSECLVVVVVVVVVVEHVGVDCTLLYRNMYAYMYICIYMGRNFFFFKVSNEKDTRKL